MKAFCCAFLVTCAAVAPAQTLRPLERFGERLEPACAPSQWQEIESGLHTLAQRRNPGALAALVKTWLCDHGPAADAFLHRHMPKTLAWTAWATGIDELHEFRTPRSEIQALGGEAWDVKLDAENGEIIVSFAPNEACGHAGHFRYRSGKWKLTEFHEGCD